MNKKIIFDGRFLSLSHGGIGRYSLELLREMLPLAKNLDFALIVLPKTKFDDHFKRILNENEARIIVHEIEAKHYSYAEQFKMPRLIKHLKGNLVHYPHFNHPVFDNSPFVVTIHDLTLSQYAERGSFIQRKAYEFAITHAAKKSLKVLTVSDFVKKELIKEFDLNKNKVVTTYNGIDQKFCKITNPNSLMSIEKFNLKNKYILSVGQWRSHKNLLRLVEAYALLKKNSDAFKNIDLVFAGKIDPKYPQLIDKIERMGLTNNVKFTGFIADDDLPTLYNNSSAFIFPSLSEGFGLPALEAQSCNVPVISSNRTCLPEVCGKGALYFNPEDVNDMAKQIEKVIVDKKLRDELVKYGEANAKKFTWRHTAEQTLEVYEEILYKKVI